MWEQLWGDPGREVHRVLVSLDITEPVVRRPWKAGSTSSCHTTR